MLAFPVDVSRQFSVPFRFPLAFAASLQATTQALPVATAASVIRAVNVGEWSSAIVALVAVFIGIECRWIALDSPGFDNDWRSDHDGGGEACEGGVDG